MLTLLGLVAISSCSRDKPTAPRPHSITGRVRLTGFLVDDAGHFSGTRLVDDADGVAVQLVYGDRVIAQSTTVDGVYRFSGIGPGAYVAQTVTLGDLSARTPMLTIADSDVIVGDALELVSRGDLYPVPNPLAPHTIVYYELPDTEFVSIRVLDMAGDTVRALFSGERPAGLNVVIWDGSNEARQPAAGTLFWMTLAADDGIRTQLLFK